MKLNRFTGGMNTTETATLLRSDKSVLLENIDAERSTLTNIKDNQYLEAATNVRAYYHKAEDNIIYKDLAIQGTEEYNGWILARNSSDAYPTQHKGLNDYRVGIAKPSNITVAKNGKATLPSTSTLVYDRYVGYYQQAGSNPFTSGDTLEYAVKYLDMLAPTEKTKDIVFFSHTLTTNSEMVVQIQGSANFQNVLYGGIEIYRKIDGVYKLVDTKTTSVGPTYTFIDDSTISGTTELTEQEVPPQFPVEDIEYMIFNVSGGTPNYILHTINKVDIDKFRGATTSFLGIGGATYKNLFPRFDPSSTGSDDYIFRKHNGVWRHINPSSLYDKANYFFDCLYDVSHRKSLEEVISDGDIPEYLQGNISYVITHYSTETDTESVPSNIKIINDADYDTATITLPTTTDPQVDKVNIYRLGNNITNFTFVAQVNYGTATYSDTNSDIDLTGILLDSYDNYPADVYMGSPVEYKGMMFWVNTDVYNPSIRFSKQGEIRHYPQEYTIPIDYTWVGHYAINDRIVVFTEKEIFVIYGTSPSDLYKKTISSNFSCLLNKRITVMGNSIYFINDGDIYSTDGSSIRKVSNGECKFYGASKIEANNGKIYILQNKKIYILDFELGGKIYTITDSKIEVATDIINSGDNLYFISGAYTYKLVDDSGSVTVVDRELTYHSPIFSEGSLSESKIYDKVYFCFYGNFTVEVLIDGISSGEHYISYNGDKIYDTYQYSIDHDIARGTNLQLKIKGTGDIFEVEWRAEGEKDGI